MSTYNSVKLKLRLILYLFHIAEDDSSLRVLLVYLVTEGAGYCCWCQTLFSSLMTLCSCRRLLLGGFTSQLVLSQCHHVIHIRCPFRSMMPKLLWDSQSEDAEYYKQYLISQTMSPGPGNKNKKKNYLHKSYSSIASNRLDMASLLWTFKGAVCCETLVKSWFLFA